MNLRGAMLFDIVFNFKEIITIFIVLVTISINKYIHIVNNITTIIMIS